MRTLKHVAAFVLVFLGLTFIISALGLITSRVWIYFFSFMAVGILLLILGNKMNKPFLEERKAKKLERSSGVSNERKE
ncbi:MAG: hypothetical protein PHY48_14830 [Candidatus Cloacimonetes bacterium]|nr:hypothetical protein [Candidatus Cloacimonadota bacterium]